MWYKLLRVLQITQQRNKKVNNKIVKLSVSRRLNPYNPLTYVYVIGMYSTGLIAFGIIGIWQQVDIRKNPFKWS